MSGRPPARWLVALVIAAGAVAAWKIAALALAFEAPEATAGWLTVKALLAVVGMTFLACGLLVLRLRPGRASLVFAGYAICAGLHWGGPLELAPGGARTALLLVYVLVSSFLAETLLLHFALLFPRRLGLAERKPWMRLLYAPAVAAWVPAAVYLAAPPRSELRAAAEGTFFLAHEVVSNLFPLLALAIFVAHLVRPGLGRAAKRYAALMVGGMLTAWLPYLIASALGAETDPWNLTVLALPVCFTIGILGMSGPCERAT